MSESHDDLKQDLQQDQAPKRRRRSGWDQPAVNSVSTAPSVLHSVPHSTIPTLPQAPIPIPPPVPSAILPPPNPLHQNQIQDTMVAIALQRAQLALQQATKSSTGLGGPKVSQPGTHLPLPTLTPTGTTVANPTASDCKLYVGSIYYDITEENIRSLFTPFGTIKKIDMSATGMGKHKGYCFIEYTTSAAAHAAIAMDGFEISGRKIKVGWPNQSNNAQLSSSSIVAPPPPPESTTSVAPLPSMIAANMLLQALGEKLPESNKLLARNIHSAISIEDLLSIFSVFGEINSCDFAKDDNTSMGVGGSTKSAILIFANVQNAHDAFMQMNSFSLAGLPIFLSIVPNEPKTTVVLENMVLASEIDDPELKEEVIEEASRFGTLTDITVAVDSLQQVQIQITYSSEDMAKLAMSKLNNRSFAKRTIRAYLK